MTDTLIRRDLGMERIADETDGAAAFVWRHTGDVRRTVATAWINWLVAVGLADDIFADVR